MANIICIDAGHGGVDSGAVGNGIKEKDYTLKISLYQTKRLKELGFKVILTRDKDITLSNTQRTNIVKNSGAKVCISNHINSAGNKDAHGAETIHSIYNNGELAKSILNELGRTGLHTRRAFSKKGKRGDYYFMHRNTGSVQTIIVEYCFISNKADVENLKKNWEKYAEAVVAVICRYYNIEYTSPEVKKDTPDEPSTWAKEAWDWVKEQKLLDGKRPKSNLTRQEFAVVLYRLHKNNII